MRGSLKERPPGSGRFVLVYDLNPDRAPSEKRRQRKERFRGKKRDAERLLNQRVAEAARGTLVDDRGMTFNQLAQLFLGSKRLSVAPTTLALYERSLNHHIVPVLGHIRIRALRKEHVEGMLSGACDKSRRKRRGAPLSVTTLRNLLVVAKAVLEYGVENDWLSRNVARRVALPGYVESNERIPLTIQDIPKITQMVLDSELQVLVPFAIATGLRRGEIAALKWQDIDLKNGIVTVRRAAANLGRSVIYKQPTSRKSRRSDLMPAAATSLLKRHRRAQERTRKRLAHDTLTEDDFVFTMPNGKPWDPNELSRCFARLVRRKGLSGIRFHDLRHGYATVANEVGVPLKTISESLGHSSIAVTSNVYMHLLQESRKDKARRLDRVLRSALSQV